MSGELKAGRRKQPSALTVRRRAAVAAIGAAVGVLGACGGDDSVEGPMVDEIGPAVEALEREIGEGQDFFEINADAGKVTLWVASDDASRATPYVFADGELTPADEPQDADGETFTADEGLTFDQDTVLDQVLDDFGDNVQQFSIVGGPGDVVRFGVIVQSDRGGQLDVGLGPDGQILEASAVS